MWTLKHCKQQVLKRYLLKLQSHFWKKKASLFPQDAGESFSLCIFWRQIQICSLVLENVAFKCLMEYWMVVDVWLNGKAEWTTHLLDVIHEWELSFDWNHSPVFVILAADTDQRTLFFFPDRCRVYIQSLQLGLFKERPNTHSLHVGHELSTVMRRSLHHYPFPSHQDLMFKSWFPFTGEGNEAQSATQGALNTPHRSPGAGIWTQIWLWSLCPCPLCL